MLQLYFVVISKLFSLLVLIGRNEANIQTNIFGNEMLIHDL